MQNRYNPAPLQLMILHPQQLTAARQLPHESVGQVQRRSVAQMHRLPFQEARLIIYFSLFSINSRAICAMRTAPV